MGTPLESREAQAEEVLDRLYEEYPDTTISLSYSNRLELLIARHAFGTVYRRARQQGHCGAVREVRRRRRLRRRRPGGTGRRHQLHHLLQQQGEVHPLRVRGHHREARRRGSGHHVRADRPRRRRPEDRERRPPARPRHRRGHRRRHPRPAALAPPRADRRGVPRANRGGPDAGRPERDWQQFTHLFISHGRAVCDARNPDCDACVLEDVCPSSKLDHNVDLASGEAW